MLSQYIIAVQGALGIEMIKFENDFGSDKN